MDNSWLIGGAAVAGIGFLAAGWDHIKGFFRSITSLLIVHMSLRGQSAYAMSMYLLRTFDRLPTGDITIVGLNEYVRPEKVNQLIAMRIFSQQGSLLRRGKKFIHVKSTYESIDLSFIRGTFRFKELVSESITMFNQIRLDQEGANRFFVTRKLGSVGEKMTAIMGSKKKGSDDEGDYFNEDNVDRYTAEILGWEFDDIGQPKVEHAVECLSLAKPALEAFEDLKMWKEKESWYKSNLLPWTLGWL